LFHSQVQSLLFAAPVPFDCFGRIRIKHQIPTAIVQAAAVVVVGVGCELQHIAQSDKGG
jgi:hypothetical protein